MVICLICYNQGIITVLGNNRFRDIFAYALSILEKYSFESTFIKGNAYVIINVFIIIRTIHGYCRLFSINSEFINNLISVIVFKSYNVISVLGKSYSRSILKSNSVLCRNYLCFVFPREFYYTACISTVFNALKLYRESGLSVFNLF